MIKFLREFSDLTFPIATLKKTHNLKDTASSIIYEGSTLTKRGNLLDTFNINEAFLPETYAYIHNPESLLKDTKIIDGKLIIDNELNIYVPVRKIKLAYRSCKFVRKTQGFIQVESFPNFLPEVFPKDEKYPLLCIVNDYPFLIGWTAEKVKPYESFI